MAATAARAVPSRNNDRTLAIGVSLGALLMIAAIWAWARSASAPAVTDRPIPAWLGVNRVIAQLTDGRMLKVRVDLQLQDQDAVHSLTPHQEAFRSMVEEISAEMSRDELQGPEGMTRLAGHIRSASNSYLAEQRIPHRVKDVMFEEWTLMP
jgi:flagellar basal body-associated protein FliL